MPADHPSFPEPPVQSKVRVLREADGVSLTNEPDPGRGSTDRGFDGSGGRFPSGQDAAHVMGSSCIRNVFKLTGLFVVMFGGGLLTWALIATVVFDVPMHINGRIAGKGESVLFLLGFLAFVVGFGASGSLPSTRSSRRPGDIGDWSLGTTNGCCGGAVSVES